MRRSCEIMFNIALAIVVTAIVVLLNEVCSSSPNMELRPATILEVTEDRCGYIGYDDMTWIRYDDGMPGRMPGRCGKPGDRILAWRQFGTASWLGICGDTTHRKAQRRASAPLRENAGVE